MYTQIILEASRQNRGVVMCAACAPLPVRNIVLCVSAVVTDHACCSKVDGLPLMPNQAHLS